MDVHPNPNIIGFVSNPDSSPILLNAQCTQTYYQFIIKSNMLINIRSSTKMLDTIVGCSQPNNLTSMKFSLA